jgi:hypothetical protein
VWDSNASGLFFIWIIYITLLSLKNYGKKWVFGGKNKS